MSTLQKQTVYCPSLWISLHTAPMQTLLRLMQDTTRVCGKASKSTFKPHEETPPLSSL